MFFSGRGFAFSMLFWKFASSASIITTLVVYRKADMNQDNEETSALKSLCAQSQLPDEVLVATVDEAKAMRIPPCLAAHNISVAIVKRSQVLWSSANILFYP
jgi:hypothetical protein